MAEHGETESGGSELHELLASEAYWSGDSQRYYKLGDTWPLLRGFVDVKACGAINQAFADLANASGIFAVEVPEGQAVPLLDQGTDELLRIVLDTRTISLGRVTTRGWMETDAEGFHGIVSAMGNSSLYDGHAAKTKVQSGLVETAEVERSVWYGKAGKVSGWLATIPSYLMGGKFNVVPRPQLRVGSTYRNGRRELIRIDSASILTPDNTEKTSPIEPKMSVPVS